MKKFSIPVVSDDIYLVDRYAYNYICLDCYTYNIQLTNKNAIFN